MEILSLCGLDTVLDFMPTVNDADMETISMPEAATAMNCPLFDHSSSRRLASPRRYVVAHTSTACGHVVFDTFVCASLVPVCVWTSSVCGRPAVAQAVRRLWGLMATTARELL